jgi:hypothetical protein
MSKRRSREQPAKKARGTRGGEDVALRLAAIRWYVLNIERRAMELILTNPAAYDKLNRILFETWSKLKITKVQRLAGCPPPWKQCDDECRPECDDIRLAEPNS